MPDDESRDRHPAFCFYSSVIPSEVEESLVPPKLRNERLWSPDLVGERRARRSSFFSVVQVQPRLNVMAIAETCFLLRLGEFLARLVSPATFPKEGVPDGNFLVAGLPFTRKAPFEDFFVRSTLQRSLDKLTVIYS
jgi:hypothetical protein